MKYCAKCGRQMADDMMFCQKCGTKADDTIQPVKPDSKEPPKSPPPPRYYMPPVEPPAKKPLELRTGMKVGMVICFSFALIYGLIAIAIPTVFFMSIFLSILGFMFLLLGITPKKSKYMFGKESGLKKSLFVIFCISSAVIFSIIVAVTTALTTPSDNTKTNQIQEVHSETNSAYNNTTVEENEEITTMAGIKKWYESQMPTVGQSLSEYATSVDGLTVLNVTSSKFLFGKNSDWYNCHYTFTFTCQIDGVYYQGEARAFMKYNDDTINWFHFEIFSNNNATSIVEHYDDSYEQIIEDYYKELESTYN